MNIKEIVKYLDMLVKEDDYGNPLYIGTDDLGEKYRQALQEAITELNAYRRIIGE
jgi:hypothetical protein